MSKTPLKLFESDRPVDDMITHEMLTNDIYEKSLKSNSSTCVKHRSKKSLTNAKGQYMGLCSECLKQINSEY